MSDFESIYIDDRRRARLSRTKTKMYQTSRNLVRMAKARINPGLHNGKDHNKRF